MNEPSFVVALAFYFVMLGLISYWVAYQAVRVIRAMQKMNTSHGSASRREKRQITKPATCQVYSDHGPERRAGR
jgi:hypothetical protein